MKNRARLWIGALAIGGALALVGCGKSEEAPKPKAETETVKTEVKKVEAAVAKDVKAIEKEVKVIEKNVAKEAKKASAELNRNTRNMEPSRLIPSIESAIDTQCQPIMNQ